MGVYYTSSTLHPWYLHCSRSGKQQCTCCRQQLRQLSRYLKHSQCNCVSGIVSDWLFLLAGLPPYLNFIYQCIWAIGFLILLLNISVNTLNQRQHFMTRLDIYLQLPIQSLCNRVKYLKNFGYFIIIYKNVNPFFRICL